MVASFKEVVKKLEDSSLKYEFSVPKKEDLVESVKALRQLNVTTHDLKKDGSLKLYNQGKEQGALEVKSKKIYGITHNGGPSTKYDNNEDAIGINVSGGGTFLVISDGVGGAASGEIASRNVTEALIESQRNKDSKSSFQDMLKQGFENYKQSKDFEHLKNNGADSTLALAEISKNGVASFATCGDSRVICINNGEITASSIDDNLTQYSSMNGEKSENERLTAGGNNVITNSFYNQGNFNPSTFDKTLQDGEYIVLASDGLWDVLPNNKVNQVVKELSKDGYSPEEIALSLEYLVLKYYQDNPNKKADNFSIVVYQHNSEKMDAQISSTVNFFEKNELNSTVSSAYGDYFRLNNLCHKWNQENWENFLSEMSVMNEPFSNVVVRLEDIYRQSDNNDMQKAFKEVSKAVDTLFAESYYKMPEQSRIFFKAAKEYFMTPDLVFSTPVKTESLVASNDFEKSKEEVKINYALSNKVEKIFSSVFCDDKLIDNKREDFNAITVELMRGEKVEFGRSLELRENSQELLPKEFFPSTAVSRKHFSLRYDQETEKLFITDLASANGTHLNSRRLEPHREVELKDIDRVSFGIGMNSKVERFYNYLNDKFKRIFVHGEELNTQEKERFLTKLSFDCCKLEGKIKEENNKRNLNFKPEDCVIFKFQDEIAIGRDYFSDISERDLSGPLQRISGEHLKILLSVGIATDDFKIELIDEKSTNGTYLEQHIKRSPYEEYITKINEEEIYFDPYMEESKEDFLPDYVEKKVVKIQNGKRIEISDIKGIGFGKNFQIETKSPWMSS